MIVERIWTGNAYRNFNYLVACGETGEALAVDPLDHEKCLQRAKVRGWQITQVLNTHEHGDHTGGNAAVIKATGARLLAHHKAGGRIPGVDRGLQAGDVVKVGKSVELECLDTPGHTLCHVCLRAHGDQAALFSGDTLFNAGAGNCHNGGDVGLLFATFAEQLAKLPDDTRVYPGHDYIENNLRLHARPRARQCRRRGAAARGEGPRPRGLEGVDGGRGEGLQHLLPPGQPGGDRAAARALSRAARSARCEDGVHQAARAAQQVVRGGARDAA